MKSKLIKNKILKELTVFQSGSSKKSLIKEYLFLARIFKKMLLRTKEFSRVKKEKYVIREALSIMERIFNDPEASAIISQKLGSSYQITNTLDFFIFLRKITE